MLGIYITDIYFQAADASSAVDEDGMLNDVQVISIDDENDAIKKKINPTADVKHFFELIPYEGYNKKKHSACNSCTFVFFLLS